MCVYRQPTREPFQSCCWGRCPLLVLHSACCYQKHCTERCPLPWVMAKPSVKGRGYGSSRGARNQTGSVLIKTPIWTLRHDPNSSAHDLRDQQIRSKIEEMWYQDVPVIMHDNCDKTAAIPGISIALCPWFSLQNSLNNELKYFYCVRSYLSRSLWQEQFAVNWMSKDNPPQNAFISNEAKIWGLPAPWRAGKTKQTLVIGWWTHQTRI